MKLTENAIKVLERRYLARDEDKRIEALLEGLLKL